MFINYCTKKQFFRVMRIATFFMVWGLLQVSAKTSAQLISLSGKNLPLMDVLKEIRQQSGYDFIFAASALEHALPVSMDIRELPLKEALRQVFAHQPLSYDIADRSVTVWMNAETGASRSDVAGRTQGVKKTPSEGFVFSFPEVRGRVVDSLGQPLVGASVRVINAEGKRTTLQTKTDHDGYFELKNVPEDAQLEVTYIGYVTATIKALIEIGNVVLKAAESELEEVEVMVNTGYQTIPKERATGSFSHIDNELFNQQVGTTIMERLEAIGNGIVVDRTYSETPNLMVRGLSTIEGPREVLIIVDNFPYDGNINNINPNDVEDITILKDAAAASIWGARAGNGVIVITTKKGRYNQPITTSVNSNITVGTKPDLFKVPQMSSASYIEFETLLYESGYYDSKINQNPSYQILSPAVELLIKRDAAETDLERNAAQSQIELLKQQDIRDDMMRYLYRNAINQQYALNVMGGTSDFAWTGSANYDRNVSELHALYDRLNVQFKQVFRPIKNVEINSGIYFTQSNQKNGAYGYGNVTQTSNGFYPYTRIADDRGNPLGIARIYRSAWTDTVSAGKLLDWNYYPLTDWRHNTEHTKLYDITVNAGLNYKTTFGLAADVKYQYERQIQESNTLWGVQSHQMRSTLNLYTQVKPDGTIEFGYPYGGQYWIRNSQIESHQVRPQISFDRSWEKHDLIALIGGEVRMLRQKGNGSGVYGYDEELLTHANLRNYSEPIPSIIGGSTRISGLISNLQQKATNFVSFFGNAAYTYLSRYTVSVSARSDASNLFGLNINDQWNPFFSTGLSWDVSNEDFYQSSFLPYLKLRATYGFSGNINPAMVALTTISYLTSTHPHSNGRQAAFQNYYNPDLRWETAKQLNIGLDFRARSNIISGSVEYFHKRGDDLFGNALLDYTGGVGPSITKNVASISGDGVDVDLNVQWLNKRIKWSSKINQSVYHDKIDDYYLGNLRGNLAAGSASFQQGKPVRPGFPVNGVYSFKWGGLDPTNGDPLGYIGDELSNNYSAIYSNTTVDDMVFHGSSIPTYYGSLINQLSYKNFEVNVGLSFKMGYFFRRRTIHYNNLATQVNGHHNDFEKRWQTPGDEQFTDVPSFRYPFVYLRENFYGLSDIFVEKGDHVRLQYLQLNYNLSKSNFPQLPFTAIRIYANANNLGILWRANKSGIDPDAVYGSRNYEIPAISSFTFGFSLNL